MEPQEVPCVENMENNNQIIIVTPSGDRYTITPVLSLTNENVQTSPTREEPETHCSVPEPNLLDTQPEQHVESDATTGIQCKACNRHFDYQERLTRHILAAHAELKPTTCPTCRKDFKRLDILAHHSVSCQSEYGKYHCRECDFVANTLLKLEEHETAHAAERHVCSDCGNIYKRREHLTRHYRSVHLMESVECMVCLRVFRRKDHMLRHIRTKHRLMYNKGKLIRLRTYCQDIPEINASLKANI